MDFVLCGSENWGREALICIVRKGWRKVMVVYISKLRPLEIGTHALGFGTDFGVAVVKTPRKKIVYDAEVSIAGKMGRP